MSHWIKLPESECFLNTDAVAFVINAKEQATIVAIDVHGSRQNFYGEDAKAILAELDRLTQANPRIGHAPPLKVIPPKAKPDEATA